MNEVGENNECRKLKMRAEYLKGQYAEALEEYMSLATVGGDAIKARYMVALGGLEHQVYELKIEALRWRRRIELWRAAEARGERPDPLAIEEQVTAELAAYQSKLDELRAMVREQRQRQGMATLSEAEVTEIRHGYLKAAKRLHPDLAKNLPKAAAVLWQKITDAYGGKDWTELRFLLGLVEGVLSGTATMVPTNAIDELKAEIERLQQKLDELLQKKSELMKTKPYCWVELLDDEDDVERRRGVLQAELEKYKDEIAACEQQWNEREEAA